VCHEKSTTADVTTAGIYHCFGVAHGNRGIDCIAALPEHSNACLGSQPMS
jgi:hypothetical protein